MKGKQLFLTLALAPGLVVGGAKIIGTKSSDKPAFDEDTKKFAAFSEVVQDKFTRKGSKKTKRKQRSNSRKRGTTTRAKSTNTP
jgi:hypothetical protein